MRKNDTSYTVLELKSIAKERGLKGYSNKRKDELCALLDIPVSNKSDSLHKSPVSILKKRPAEALTPVTLHVTSLQNNKKNTKSIEITVYIKPCDRNKLVFPCNIKLGEVMDYPLGDYKKSYTDREAYARVANIELEKEKKKLRAKKNPSSIVKFNV